MTTLNTKNLQPRAILATLEKQLNRDNILVVVGSRQVGKTSLLALLFEGLGQKTKIYFDLEDMQLSRDFNNLGLDDFPRFLEEKIGLSLQHKKVFVFIDEIQYLDNPSSLLKYVFDHFKNIKIIVSGSSSLEIKKKFSDRLTGRKYLHTLQPLSFAEFLAFKGRAFKIREDVGLKRLLTTTQKITNAQQRAVSWSKKEINELFQEFVLYGGYPRAALTKSKEEKINILKEIYSAYARKDVKDLAEIENIKTYNDLIEVAASQSAGLLNVDELSNTLNANRKTLDKYLFLLENTFIIGLLRPFYTNKRKEITKMPKLFLEDTGLRNMLLKNFTAIQTRPDKGALIENFVYTELKKNLGQLEDLYFWRTQTQAEVDFVIKGERQQLIPIEVKYKKMKNAQIPSGLQSFITSYDVRKAFVITDDLLDQINVGKKTTVYFLPAFLI